ncbi:hypothetical protein Salmuc_04689 [Salipiger mucosus DSM 16094]|uniref:Uncharacterized protein n=2 Tax=Salipiger mucosus TaxID=263378 RepID=S9QAY1_9RHOB|nr:hypothetical protein Salmuc_04689 [Salipiger mucosus DSM 16094]
MPILRNRTIRVGDIMKVDPYEDVLAAASRCYLSLETQDDSPRSHYMWTSLEAVVEASAGAEIKKVVEAEAGLQGAFEKSAAIIFEDITATVPDPDMQELHADKVENIDGCRPTLEVLKSRRYDSILATRIYQATVSAGFVFDTSGDANAKAAAGKLTKQLSDVSGEVSVQGGKEWVTLGEWTHGVIAVQSSRLNPDELARAWLLMNENPETLAQLERLLGEYYSAEDPGRWQELKWTIKNFLEEYGWAEETIDDLRRRIYGSEGVEAVSLEDIPAEHWRATGALAAAMLTGTTS